MVKKKLSKAQLTKEVRRILLRYQVHMSKCFFSANLTSIYLSGTLVRNDGKEFKHTVVNLMTQEILAYASIRCELDNWIIGHDGVYYTGDEDKKAG